MIIIPDLRAEISKDSMINYLEKVKQTIFIDTATFSKCIDIIELLLKRNYIAIDMTYPAIVYIANNKLAAQFVLAGIFYGQERLYSHTTKIIEETRKINAILGTENTIRKDFCSSKKMKRRVRYNKIRALWESGEIIDLFNSYMDNLPKQLSIAQREQCIAFLKYMGNNNINKCAIAIFPIIVYFVTASEIGFIKYSVFDGNLIRYYIGCTKNNTFSIEQLLRKGHILGFDLNVDNIIPYSRIAPIGIELIREKILDLPETKIFQRDFYKYSHELSNGTDNYYKNSKYQDETNSPNN